MRKSAVLAEPQPHLKRLVLYEDEQGVYLFGYDTLEDAGCVWDAWFKTVADAEEAAQQKYRVAPTAWKVIAEPLPNCQHDWITPVRVAGRTEGNPRWEQLEKLIDGQWVLFNHLV